MMVSFGYLLMFVISLVMPSLHIADIRISSSTFQLAFPEGATIDVMDSYIIGSCMHMSLYVVGRERPKIMQRLSGLIFEDQRDMRLFSVEVDLPVFD